MRARQSDALPAATPSENQHRVLSPPHVLLSGQRSKIRATERVNNFGPKRHAMTVRNSNDRAKLGRLLLWLVALSPRLSNRTF
jgi:hypothetical protein